MGIVCRTKFCPGALGRLDSFWSETRHFGSTLTVIQDCQSDSLWRPQGIDTGGLILLRPCAAHALPAALLVLSTGERHRRAHNGDS